MSCIRFATGIEFREGSLTISPKCTLTVRKGMTLNVNLGFSGLSNSEAAHSADKTYAIFIGDTVLAGDEVHTSGCWPGSRKSFHINI